MTLAEAQVPTDWRSWPEWDRCRLRWRLMTDLARPPRKPRPEQLPPSDDDWLVWFFQGGRGAGKTRAGAEDIANYARENPGSRLALVGPILNHVRVVMVEGESGLLSILPPSALVAGSVEASWNRGVCDFTFANGSTITGFSSEVPSNLRGPQHHRAWGDEPAEWKDAWRGDAEQTTWSNMLLGLRLGEHPQVVLTGTPRKVKLVKQLVGWAENGRRGGRVVLSHGTTYDNLDNLAPTFRDEILAQYEGTRLGEQELMARLLEDVEGALWKTELIDPFRREPTEAPPMRRIVVAVDPSWGTTGSEVGIVVAGLGHDGRGYVLEDCSGLYPPAVWGERVKAAYEKWGADRIVAEVNFAAETVKLVMKTVDPNLRYKEVRASRGKAIRAEPVVGLYEQGKVSHVGTFPFLEAQMTEWIPPPEGDKHDPFDRGDALVWALTELMLTSSNRKASIVVPDARRLPPVSRMGATTRGGRTWR